MGGADGADGRQRGLREVRVACDGAGERDRAGDALVDNREAWLVSRDPLIALWDASCLQRTSAPIRK